MKKILFYIYSLNKGGAERVLLTLADKLNKDENTEIVIVTDTVDEREYKLPQGIRRINLEETSVFVNLAKLNVKFKGIARLLSFRKVCRNEAPDKIVAFMVSGAIRAIRATAFSKYKVIAAVRSNPYEEFGEHKAHKRLIKTFANAEKIICQTEYQKDFFVGLTNKCRVIFNPIFDDFEMIPYSGEREKTIVSTGRLFDYKNHKLLINAFVKLADKYPDHKLIIYGEGPYRQELEEEINALSQVALSTRSNLKDRILLPGDSENVAEDIRRASVYVLPSDTEGMPNGLMEAMALGLACISTDCPCGGPASLIKDGVNGCLVPVGDVELMTKKLDEVLSDINLQNKLGNEATKIRDICNADKIADMWRKELYEHNQQ